MLKLKIYLLFILLITATVPAAFAQFKTPASRNFRNLESFLVRTAETYRPTAGVSRGPVMAVRPGRSVAAAATQLPVSKTLAVPFIHTSALQLLKTNHLRIAEMRTHHVYDDVWEIMDTPKTYTSQYQLGQDLADFYYQYPVARFRSRVTQQVGEVYELPIEGIRYAPKGRQPVLIDPQTHVLFYIEGVGGQILERSLLENSLYFEPVHNPE